LPPPTRCQFLRLKCTKFNFGWDSAPDPAGGAYSAPPDPLAGLRGLTSKGRGEDGKGKRRERGRGQVPTLCPLIHISGYAPGLNVHCDRYLSVLGVARSPVFSGSSRISAPISRLPDRSQNLSYLTRCSLASEINVLETFCSLLIGLVHSTIFIARQHTDARY